MSLHTSARPYVAPSGCQADAQAAELAHDLANTLQDTRLALAHLRVFLRQREAGYAADLREQLSTIEASLATNEALLNIFSATARPGAALAPLSLTETDARQLVQAVLRQLRSRAADRRVSLCLSQPSGALPPISCDPALLARALLNIIGNAITYTGAARADGSGRVLVVLDQLGPQVHIVVSDNGPGIPEDTLARFERPRRSGEARPRGNGLGLAFVRRVLDEHPYGTLTIRSTPGLSTTVIIGVATTVQPLRECSLGNSSEQRDDAQS